MGKKRTYRVYFSQINQTRYEVEAGTRDAAIKRAEKLWKEDYAGPLLSAVEADLPNEWEGRG